MATYKYWLENVEDWCISRQLWWGQQIPAWYAPDGSFRVAATRGDAYALFAGNDGERPPFGAELLRQDEDVLDTWFSSWLWPIEVFKGITDPGNADITYYYPTAVLVTGQDIIFFWVARMIMAGLWYSPDSLPMEKRIPFRDVYFTGMVRDKQGRKMSKSLGNSPELLGLIEKYGADAVRFGIMIASPAGNDLLFDEAALEQGRNFNNKLWNALKLVKGWESRLRPTLSHSAPPTSPHAISTHESADGTSFAIQWFEHRLREARATLEQLFTEFRLSEALKTLYSLIWDDFCSWYLEWVKPGFEQPMDAAVYHHTVRYFEQLLQLLHPFMPFITEEIYHLLADRGEGDDLCILQFEKFTGLKVDNHVIANGEFLKAAITEIRNLRINGAFSIYLTTAEFEELFPLIRKMSKAATVDIYANQIIEGVITVVVGKTKILIETERPTTNKEELLKELAYQKGFLESVNMKLDNERFVQNAKPEVVDLERKKKEDAEAKIKVLEESIAGIRASL
jgi:valyl-tRNA synthetase